MTMTNPQPWYLSATGLVVAFLAGVLAASVPLLVIPWLTYRRLLVLPWLKDGRPPYWLPLLQHGLYGLVAAIFLYAVRHGLHEPKPGELLEGAIEALIVAIALELRHTAQFLEKTEGMLQLIQRGERIIFARQNLTNHSADEVS